LKGDQMHIPAIGWRAICVRTVAGRMQTVLIELAASNCCSGSELLLCRLCDLDAMGLHACWQQCCLRAHLVWQASVPASHSSWGTLRP
jgi:hypothetical protein